MKKILLEISPIEQDRPTGVNYFTEWFAKSLYATNNKSFGVGFFWLNFLGRKSPRNSLTKRANQQGRLYQIRAIPQRVYAKLIYYNIAPPLFLPKADWVIFSNFYIWPILRKTKRAALIHDIGYLRYPEYVEEKNLKFLRKVVARTIKNADLIMTISECMRGELIELAGVPPEKVLAINIPIDAEQFDKRYDKGSEHLRQRYGIAKPYILNLGTLEPRKNLETTVLAYCALPKKDREQYSLVLAGKWGWKVDGLRKLIEEKQRLGYDIITPGHIDYDDKTTFFRNASFFLVTPHYEGFGMPLLEALHCGIPSVAVDIPVLREVGGDACLWARRDPKDISRQLHRLMSDEQLALSLKRSGQQRSRSFSWDKVAATVKDYLITH